MKKINTVIFNLGGDPPGQARVELIKKTGKIVLGYPIWSVRIIEVLRPSTVGVSCKSGQVRKVSERWLENE